MAVTYGGTDRLDESIMVQFFAILLRNPKNRQVCVGLTHKGFRTIDLIVFFIEIKCIFFIYFHERL